MHKKRRWKIQRLFGKIILLPVSQPERLQFFSGDTAVLVASEFHDHVLIGDVDDNAVETAGGYYAVAYSQLCQHGIQLFLLFLLGSDGKEVHDHYDYNDVNQSEADADTACCCGVT